MDLAVDSVVVDVFVSSSARCLFQTEKIIQHAVSEHLPITLVINKIDRLILELKLPPTDTYYKLMHTIEEVNNLISAATTGVSPCGCGLYQQLFMLCVCARACSLCALFPAVVSGMLCGDERVSLCFSLSHHKLSHALARSVCAVCELC